MPDSTERETLRLQVYLAHCGLASRRACEVYISEGRVSVNGEVVTSPGTKVSLEDTVCVDVKPLHLEKRKRYILLNKPAGYVCSSSDEKGRASALDLLAGHFSERLYNVGRLDMYSSGLIIFTNDGDFAAKIAHPSSCIEKEYIVEALSGIPQVLVDRFKRGIRIDGVFYRCKDAELLSPKKLRVVLEEGKNREIRRMFAFFEITIRRLTRIRIGTIENTLEEGKFRELRPEEISDLLSLSNRGGGPGCSY